MDPNWNMRFGFKYRNFMRLRGVWHFGLVYAKSRAAYLREPREVPLPRQIEYWDMPSRKFIYGIHSPEHKDFQTLELMRWIKRYDNITSVRKRHKLLSAKAFTEPLRLHLGCDMVATPTRDFRLHHGRESKEEYQARISQPQ